MGRRRSTGDILVNRLIALLLLVICCPLEAQTNHDRNIASESAVVTLDKASSEFVTKVNGRIPRHGVLKALSSIERREGVQAVLMVHEDAKFKVVANLVGIMAKAGFVRPRVFLFGSDKDWMEEITYSAPLVYSEDFTQLRPLHPDAPLGGNSGR
jgi:hypothetical protein